MMSNTYSIDFPPTLLHLAVIANAEFSDQIMANSGKNVAVLLNLVPKFHNQLEIPDQSGTCYN